MFNNKPEGWVGNSFRPEPKPSKLTLFVTVPKFCVDEILLNGLTPENWGSLERLPFVILRKDEPRISTGPAAYFKMEIDEDDKRLTKANRVQYEYHGAIPVSSLTGMAYPPDENYEVMDCIDRYGWKSAEYESLWVFHPIRTLGAGADL